MSRPDAHPVESTSRLSGPARIFIGLLLGIAVGYLFPAFALAIRPLADIFLRMIKMIVAPLLFSTIVVGIAGSGDLKSLGRIGLKAIIYFEVATTIALVIGLVLVNVFQPGVGMSVPLGADTSAVAAMPQAQQHVWDMILRLFPTSVIDAMARGDILQVVVFATFFGVALAAIGAKGKAVFDVMESVAQAMFRVTHYVMWFAPVGVVRGDRCHGGRQGHRRAADARQARRADVCRARDLRAAGRLRRVAADSRALPGVRACDPRAVHAGLLHRQFRGGAARRARGDGALRCAPQHRRLRAADRLQLQPRRHDAVPVAGERVRGAAGGRAS